MRRIVFSFLLSCIFLPAGLAANVVSQCETLHARNQELIEIQKGVFSLCIYNLGKSTENIAAACSSLALNLTYQAQQSLDRSVNYLDNTKDAECRRNSLIKELRNDVVTFRNSL